MAHTYTQLYVHAVFAVDGRMSLIPESRQEEVNRYVAGILRNKKQRVLAIGGMPDHLHCFFGMTPEVSVSEIIRDVKANSSRFITANRIASGSFAWQPGYGAFTYSQSQVEAVCRYVRSQREHHRRHSFQEEFVRILQAFQVEYEDKYLFTWSEEVGAIGP